MDSLFKKNILITGGAGFIGSNLANKLCDMNHVVVLDNFLSGKKENLSENIEVIQASVQNITHINFDVNFDYVFHFGEYSRVEASTSEFLKCFENSAASIGYVIDFCRNQNCKLVYAGSSTRYSPGGQYLSPYTYFKAQNVKAIRHFCSKFKVPYVVVYFSNVYGKNELQDGPYATVIAKFLKAKFLGRAVRVTSPGSQTRAFTHIEDTISGITLAAVHGEGDGYVIGSRRQHSIIEICKLLQLDYSLIPGNSANRTNSVVDTSKITKLGWRERHCLENYISDELQNYSES